MSRICATAPYLYHPEPFDCAQDKLREGSRSEIHRFAQNDTREGSQGENRSVQVLYMSQEEQHNHL